MPTHARSNYYDDDDDTTTDDTESLVPILLAAGSALVLGYFAGRISYQRDVEEALHRIEESHDPIEITVRAL
jgi:hypothetical protein